MEMILSGELFAIYKALCHIRTTSENKSLISNWLTQRASTYLQIVFEKSTCETYKTRIYNLQSKNIIFLWVSSHTGTYGNDFADKYVKEVTLHENYSRRS